MTNLSAANATEVDTAAEADWSEFEKAAGLWSGKFLRDECDDCYDRKILR